QRHVLDHLEIEHVDVEPGDGLDVGNRIGRHEVAQFDLRRELRGLSPRATAGDRDARKCQGKQRSSHPLSLSLTTSPPRVSRTASPISSSSTGRPCSLSQKAERKLYRLRA